jgi:O-antigen/teichoic acid export membrane protein
VPLAFGLLVNAEVAALILGGEKWAGAATYLRWLALVPLVRPLAMFGLEFLLTRHRDRLLLGYTLSNLVSLAALAWFLTGTSLGPLGMALAGYFPLGNLLLTWGVWRESPSGFKLLSTQLLELDLLGAVLFLPIFFAVAPIWPRFAVSLLAALLFLAYAWRRHAESGRRFLRGTP